MTCWTWTVLVFGYTLCIFVAITVLRRRRSLPLRLWKNSTGNHVITKLHIIVSLFPSGSVVVKTTWVAVGVRDTIKLSLPGFCQREAASEQLRICGLVHTVQLNNSTRHAAYILRTFDPHLIACLCSFRTKKNGSDQKKCFATLATRT